LPGFVTCTKIYLIVKAETFNFLQLMANLLSLPSPVWKVTRT